ncbi:MAG: TorF family putative porin [Burkholderiales bacterium]
MNKTVLALAASLAFSALPTIAHAEDSPLSFNVGVFSDYRYRGISQTRLKPAVQAGVDYSIPGGFYVGAWASNIQWIKDAGGDANVEVDLYGGYKGEIAKDVSLDVGVLTYQYPRNHLSTSANTTEIYGAMSFGPATLKYSHSVSNLFGFTDSKNSGYLDASASFDVGSGVMLAPHVGYQKVAKNSDFSYTDYSLTVSKDFEGFVVSAAVVGASTKSIAGVKAYASPANGKDLGKTGLVVGVKKTF